VDHLHDRLQDQLRLIQQSMFYSPIYDADNVDCLSTNLQRAR
jgi:hypothetical protein